MILICVNHNNHKDQRSIGVIPLSRNFVKLFQNSVTSPACLRTIFVPSLKSKGVKNEQGI